MAILGNNITRLHPQGRQQTQPLANAIREHLQRVLASEHFDGSARSRDFLCFIVEEALAGRSEALTQSVIATSVFGRKGNFDAILDPVVRVQAGRLRRSLERYYLLTGDGESLRIELPKGSYAPNFVTPVSGDGRAELTLKRISLAPSTPDWPAVIINGFEVASADDREAALRFKDELVMELCRYRDVRAVRQSDLDRLDTGQQAAFRFELRGRLRHEGDDWNVSAHLIDRWSGVQVWGDEYHTTPLPGRWSSSIDDIARVIAARVGAEHGVIVRLLTTEAGRVRPETAVGFDVILNCYHFFFARQVSDLVGTVEALQRLTEREPQLSLAWTYLARLYQINYSFELSELSTPIEKAIGYAYQGVILEPTNARTRCVLAAALLCKGELQAARDELEQALRLNAESLAYREMVGWLLALSGDWDRGIAVMRDAQARNPYCLPHVAHGLWADYMRRGDFEAAYTAALEYRDATFFWREAMLTCCL